MIHPSPSLPFPLKHAKSHIGNVFPSLAKGRRKEKRRNGRLSFLRRRFNLIYDCYMQRVGESVRVVLVQYSTSSTFSNINKIPTCACTFTTKHEAALWLIVSATSPLSFQIKTIRKGNQMKNMIIHWWDNCSNMNRVMYIYNRCCYWLITKQTWLISLS